MLLCHPSEGACESMNRGEGLGGGVRGLKKEAYEMEGREGGAPA